MLLKQNYVKKWKVPWRRVKDERETSQLISMVLQQATDRHYMIDRDAKKRKTVKAKVWGRAPYGEIDGTLCSYEISSEMHFSWVFNLRWCKSLNCRCFADSIKPTERCGSKPLYIPNKTLKAAVTGGTSQLKSVHQREEKQMQPLVSSLPWSKAPEMLSR